MDISVTVQDFELKLSLCAPNIPFKSQISYLDPSSYFMSKKSNIWFIFC